MKTVKTVKFFIPSPSSEVGEGRGDSLIKVGTDLRARALSISGVNFCPGIRFWEVHFARALGFLAMCNEKE